MTFMEKLYLPSIIKGMGITGKHALEMIFKGSKGKVYAYPEVENLVLKYGEEDMY